MAAAIQASIARIHEACQAPPLAPPEYRALFEIIAQEINENSLQGAQTMSNIHARAQEQGLSVSRDDIRFIMEVVMTMMFLFIIMGATHGKAPAGFAPLAIGLALVMIHLVSIPVTNTSVNPARSTGPALFVGGWAMAQLWLFWLAPLIGGVLGGVIYRWISDEPAGVVEGRKPA